MPDLLPPLPADCWERLFGNAAPVALEIGPGRGEFLVASALREPGRNFFAIEHSFSHARQLEARLRRAAVGNARVIAGDARCLLEWIPPSSVSAVYVLFPDPWWKRRHHRRRLWTTPFVALIARALTPGGRIELVTDVPDYFALAQGQLIGEPRLEAETIGHPADLQTSFARKAARRGVPIYRSVHRRVGGAD